MATKQGNSSEKRKHSTVTSVQRKEKPHKTLKTDSTVKEVIPGITMNEKKNAVFYTVSIVSLGRPKYNLCQIYGMK
jgi:hypothetical protein